VVVLFCSTHDAMPWPPPPPVDDEQEEDSRPWRAWIV
jgi:hypothetical protein